ncbi:hypothetical protein HER10_EVM0008718 [Colletotrichum scovillei]|uniref:uncharacterized protein n=1 Tax=Colletotrichum scovillei TaxID=1209932 RepID=UPI0015C30F10|nr:uncharacterized protein HER10_EVM0008718 [Colletotrichum scovillei]KAF4773272.1 hypothetical protein HER10_EVM0008718 [Colletotrichum scovillei]
MRFSSHVPTRASLAQSPRTRVNCDNMSRILRLFGQKRGNEPSINSTDLWAEAFELLKKRENDVATAYAVYLSAVKEDADVNDLLCSNFAQSIVKQLQAQRKDSKWATSLQSKSTKMKEKVEELARILFWSETIVDVAVSDHPFTALAWSNIFILLILECDRDEQEDIFEGVASIMQLQRYWQIWEDYTAQSRSKPIQAKTNIPEQLKVKLKEINELHDRCNSFMSATQQNRIRQKSKDQWKEICDRRSIKEAVSSLFKEIEHRAASGSNDKKELSAPEDISVRLWNKAYDSIKSSDEKLVLEFEEVLVLQMIDGFDVIRQPSNGYQPERDIFKNENGKARLRLMRQVVEASFEKAQKHEGVRNGVLSVANFVVDLQTLMGAVLSTQPAVAMAWAGISAIIPLLTRPILQHEAMLEGLGHVVSSMSWYMDLSRHVIDDQWQRTSQLSTLKLNLEERIVQVYKEMLRYQMESAAFCFEKHKMLQGVRTSLGSNDWINRTMKLKELETGLKEDGEMATLLGHFKTTPYEQYMEKNPIRAPETCEWLRRNDHFNRWKQQASGLLVIAADAGCGKSVLTRHLIQDVLPYGNPHAPTTVAYFFFKDGPKQSCLKNALSAMIHQMLYQHPDIADYCREEIQAQGPALWSEIAPLWAIFKRALNSPVSRQVICVLDGLSECESSGRHALILLLKGLWTVRDSKPPPVKFLITSRRIPAILEEMQRIDSSSIIDIRRDFTLDDELDFTGVDLWQEIELAKRHRLSKLTIEKALGHRTLDFIVNSLKVLEPRPHLAPRTYLWMSAIFDALDENFEDTPEQWAELAQHCPGSLFDAYEKMLGRVSDGQIVPIKRLFHLMIAAAEPLTLQEMNVALNVPAREAAYSERDLDLPSVELPEMDVKYMRILCHRVPRQSRFLASGSRGVFATRFR